MMSAKLIAIEAKKYLYVSMFGQYAKDARFNRDNYVKLFRIDEISTSLYIALSKHSSPELKQSLEDAYLKVRAAGIYQKIMDRFYAYRQGITD